MSSGNRGNYSSGSSGNRGNYCSGSSGSSGSGDSSGSSETRKKLQFVIVSSSGSS